jgi:hypothetical protein
MKIHRISGWAKHQRCKKVDQSKQKYFLHESPPAVEWVEGVLAALSPLSDMPCNGVWRDHHKADADNRHEKLEKPQFVKLLNIRL